MSRKLKADGDTWSVRLSERSERPGFRTLLFFCTTTNQRPYRVVEVPEDRLAGSEELEGIDDAALEELFRASRSMDFPRSYD